MKSDIETRMAEYEDGQIEFAILSLVQDPILSLVSSLAANIRGLRAVSTRLDDVIPDWKSFIPSATADDFLMMDNMLDGPDTDYNLKQEAIDQASATVGVQDKLASGAVVELLALRQELVAAQAGLRASIREEQQSVRVDEDKVASRRHDYMAALQVWVRCHVGKYFIKILKDEGA